MAEVVTHRHKWAPTGLWIDGRLCSPCLDPACDFHMESGNGRPWQIGRGLLSLSVDGIDLSAIEDDPDGAVSKIVCYEITHSYHLDEIPLAPGDVVLDVGAHVGVVSVYLAIKWPGIVVHAFEPIPANFERLEKNVSRYDLDGTKGIVDCWNMPIAGSIRPVVLHGHPNGNSGGWSEFSGKPSADDVTTQSLSLRWVLDWLRADRIRLLKLDCEGAEYEIIEAGESLLDRADYLVGEVHVNRRLYEEHGSADNLLARIHRHIPPERVHMTPTRMAE